MNFVWKLVKTDGQNMGGFLEIYEIVENKKNSARVVIHYFQQLPSNNNERIAHATIYFVGEKPEITDGLFHWLNDDVSELVKKNEGKFFPVQSDPIRTVYRVMYCTNKLPDIDLYQFYEYAVN